MCHFEMDKTGFPLVGRKDEETFYHFFPITRVQFEEAVASGWLVEDRTLGLDQEKVNDMLTRGEVSLPGFQGIDEDTPEHALPIEVMLFPGGYPALNQLVRKGLQEIDSANIYSFYLTNLKQREFASLVQWLAGDRFWGGMPTYDTYHTYDTYGEGYYKFLQYHIRQLIEEILKLERLNPRARKMLKLFSKYMGTINGLPRNIFEMTRNYLPENSTKIAEFNGHEPNPMIGPDKDGYQLYYPVIMGESQLWPYIHVPGKIRHLKVECHPLVGTRGVYRRKKL
ncbi:MAG: hypothetical protein JSV88_25680 [Candidatus Aminicenantes bacterium]|nr:MAG: hypothetical protein JSV88_25680 [Candidatus Aminicenantes bacterium]